MPILQDNVEGFGVGIYQHKIVGKLFQHVASTFHPEEKNGVIPDQLVWIHELAASVDKNFASESKMPGKIPAPFVLVEDIAMQTVVFHERDCACRDWLPRPYPLGQTSTDGCDGQ